ncbi:Early light-induced protein 1 [Ranunculus cassubicifolius]
MAASTSSVQSFLSLPTTRAVQRSSATNVLLSSVKLPRQQSRNMKVCCMAEEKLPEQPTPMTTPPSPAAPKVKKVGTSFSDVLAFGGPGPERINGRLAMIGFVAAVGAELAKGEDVVAQLANGGLPWFVGTSVVLSLASLVPLFKGVNVESKSEGLMTSNAEMWNGRFAMLGLVALVFTEFVKGGALV